MARIKGWELRKNEATWKIWENRISGVEVWVTKERMFNMKTGKEELAWHIFQNSIVGAGTIATATTKQEAIKIANRYMKGIKFRQEETDRKIRRVS